MFKVVVGLGNPGKQYEGTRHNVGFQVIDSLTRSTPAGPFQEKLGGLISELREGTCRILLVKPLTFMNLSGRCVGQILGFYKIAPENLLVVCDDINLPLGKIRVRSKGSHGGNNGLRDIQAAIGLEYGRLKIGVGSPRSGDAVSHVLGKFSGAERPVIEDCLILAAQAVHMWWTIGIEETMNRFNAKGDKD